MSSITQKEVKRKCESHNALGQESMLRTLNISAPILTLPALLPYGLYEDASTAVEKKSNLENGCVQFRPASREADFIRVPLNASSGLQTEIVEQSATTLFFATCPPIGSLPTYGNNTTSQV